MLFVDSIVQPFTEGNASTEKLSVACISTTNPVYLVFKDGSTRPEFVLRRADSTDVVRAHEITEKLFAISGGLVPEPLGIVISNGHEYAIQKGVGGSPWFQIAAQYSSEVDWDNLRSRALQVLTRLHENSSRIAEWSCTCKPGELIRESLSVCLSIGTKLSDLVISRVEEMAKQLDIIGELKVFPQHGDFCLNNLMVEKKDMHVIDFEDFGMTNLPLFDEFTLALSLASQAPESAGSSFEKELFLCTQEKLEQLGIERDLLPSLFMCHLLVRLGPWSAGVQRKEYREWLLSVLDRFVLSPKEFLADF